jgi:hypothetical protein
MKIKLVFVTGILGCTIAAANAAEPVTPDNFKRVETDFNFKTKVGSGAFDKFTHIREPTPIDKQFVVRANRDTLYSYGVFDLSQPVTIVSPTDS